MSLRKRVKAYKTTPQAKRDDFCFGVLKCGLEIKKESCGFYFMGER